MQFDKQTGLNSVRELNPKIASIALQKDEQLSVVGNLLWQNGFLFVFAYPMCARAEASS